MFQKNDPIILYPNKLFPGLADMANVNRDDLSRRMKRFFADVYQQLCVYLDETKTVAKVQISINKFLDKIDKSTNTDSYTFTNNGCTSCSTALMPEFTDLAQKMNNIYSLSCCSFRLHRTDALSLTQKLVINAEFIQKYPNLIYLNVENFQVEFSEDDSIYEGFKCLREIELAKNNLKYLPEKFYNLEKISTIRIEENPIEYLANPRGVKSLEEVKNFMKSSNLVNLILNTVSIKEKDLFGKLPFDHTNDKIIVPKGLQMLALDNVSFGHLLFDLAPAESTLNSLSLTGVSWFNFDINAMVREEQVESLLGLHFDVDKVKKIYSYFDSTKRGYLNYEEVRKLNAYIYKMFPRLGKDKVYLGGLPDQIFRCVQLKILDLSYQSITFVPDQIEALVNLKELYLSNCIYLESLSTKIADLKLSILNLDNCLSLKTPPPEIVSRGLTAIFTYLKRLSTGSVLCKRTKLLLVGLGEAGKTTLVNALTSNTTKEAPAVTDGIVIKDWKINLDDGSDLTYSIWDFAGQSVYYNTHQFFLTKRAIYFLVW